MERSLLNKHLLFFCLLLMTLVSGCSYFEQNASRKILKLTTSEGGVIAQKDPGSVNIDQEHAQKNHNSSHIGQYSYNHLPPQTPQTLAHIATDQSIEDIWQRIRNGYQMDISNNHRRTRKHRSWYIEHSDYLDKILLRSEPFLYYIVEELEKRQLPMELALLPIIESAYDPFAISRSKATGLWQFIPKTGLGFGLKQNWWYDGRQDVIASTDAALDYLTQLHQQFDDWELALAAYNAGQGTIRKALKKRNPWAKQRLPNYWSLNLSKETKHYVPKFIAIAQIIKRPQQYRITLPSIANKPAFVVTQLPHQVDLARIAELIEVTPEQLLMLNSGFKRGFSDPDGPHRFLAPIKAAKKLQTALPSLRANATLTRWQPYKVQPGDTLSHIARRYQTDVVSLQKFNRLNSHFIRQGQTLVVPQLKPTLISQNTLPNQNTLTTKNRTAPEATQTSKRTYQIQPGDSLYRIARRYSTSVKGLLKINQHIVESTLLIPGQILNLPSITQ